MKSILWILISLMSVSAYAKDCIYTINLSNATVQVTTAVQVIQQSFTIVRSGGEAGKCRNYRAFFSKGLANSYQRKAYLDASNSLNYNLHSNINQNGVLKDFSDALSATERLEGNLNDAGNTYSNSFFLSVPAIAAQIYSTAGTYSDVVQVSFYGYKEASGQYEFEDIQNFTVNFIVPTKIDVSVLDEGGVFDPASTTKVVDFGILENNAERGADIRLGSNTSYQLKLSSANNGMLKLGTKSINYQLKVNGSAVALGSSQANPVQIGSGTATLSSTALYNLKIKIIEDVTNKEAGLYQDVITITAIAN